MADEPISTPADAVAAGLKPNVGPMPGTVPGGDTGGPQTPVTGKLEDMTQPVLQAPVRRGFRDQGLRPPAREGLVGKAEDVAQFNTPHVLGEIFQTIAGGKKKEWVQTPQGPVAQYRDLKPGEMARGILAAAITGLASGYDPARRGKGPAMASAFAGGFEGEQAAREKKAGQAEAEAQKEFQNKGVAEERQLARERAAREQQRLVSELTLSAKQAQEADVRIANEKTKANNDIIDRQIRAGEEKNRLTAGGGIQQVDPATGKPLEFATEHDMQEQALKDPKLMSLLHDPKYDSYIQISRDPTTGHLFVWKMPPDYATTPVWNGVEKNPDGSPKRGADGQYIADLKDPLKNAEGKVIVPTGPTTRAAFDKANRENETAATSADARKTNALARLEIAQRMKQAKYENDKMRVANEHWDLAKGDPNALDKDGNFILTPSDREYLGGNLNKRYQVLEGAAHQSQEELTAFIQAGGKEDSPDARAIRARRDAANKEMSQINTEWVGLNSTIVPSQAVNNRLREKFKTDEEGGFDVEKAVGELKATDLPKVLKDDTEKLLRVKPEPAKAAVTDITQQVIKALKDVPKAQIPDLLLNRVQKGQLSGKQADQIGDALGLEKGAWRKSELAEGLKAILPSVLGVK